MMRKTHQFEVISADGRTFTFIEYHKVITNVFGGQKTEHLGTYEWRVAGNNRKVVTPDLNDDDEFVILPENLRVRRVRQDRPGI
jgi:hypothetical protein